MQLETYNFLPIPITTIQLPTISKEIVDHVKSLEYVPWNGSLQITKEHQVLNLPHLSALRDEIVGAAERYWREVICADYSTNLVIRHSWVTKHRPGEHNPAHMHTTSLFVASVYLQAAENCGDIVFFKDNNYLNLFPAVVDMDFHTANMINRKYFSITPKKDMAVFFPCHLNHQTEINNSNEDRYALNVDFWFKGTVRKNSNGFEAEF